MLAPQAQDSLDVELTQLVLQIDREDSNLDGECRRIIASVEYDGPDDSRIDGSISKLIQRGWENAWRTQKVVYSVLFSPGSMAPDSRECREADALHHVFREMIGLVVDGATSRTRRELRESIEHYLSLRGITIDPPATEKTRKKIPPDKRTRPMNLSEAARLMGYRGTSKQKAKLLRAALDAGAMTFEQRNRQSFIFDRKDFPKSVWGKLDSPR